MNSKCLKKKLNDCYGFHLCFSAVEINYGLILLPSVFCFNWPILTGDHTRLGRISQRSPKEPLGISGVRFFLQAECLSCCPVDSVEVLKEDGRFDRTVDQTFYLVIISFSNPAVKIVHLASARAPVWGCFSMGLLNDLPVWTSFHCFIVFNYVFILSRPT